jgi:hypothetical protein
MLIEKTLKVGTKDRYEVTIPRWLDGESMTSASIELDNACITQVGGCDIDGATIGFFLLGVSDGLCNIKINFATNTRDSCEEVRVMCMTC